MKNIFLIVIAIIFAFTTTTFGQTKVPASVKTAFSQKFPNATNVKWDKENATEYEAEFVFNGKKYSANFNEKGEWLETESSIKFNQLPEKVQKTFNASHKGATVKAVAKIETSKGGIKYEVEIKNGVKTVEFLYNEDGTEIKKK